MHTTISECCQNHEFHASDMPTIFMIFVCVWLSLHQRIMWMWSKCWCSAIPFHWILVHPFRRDWAQGFDALFYIQLRGFIKLWASADNQSTKPSYFPVVIWPLVKNFILILILLFSAPVWCRLQYQSSLCQHPKRILTRSMWFGVVTWGSRTFWIARSRWCPLLFSTNLHICEYFSSPYQKV